MVNASDGRVTFDGRKTKYKRALRLTSDQLKLLNLNYGSNDARFSITTKLQVFLIIILIFNPKFEGDRLVPLPNLFASLERQIGHFRH
jgi:hypothetical protein